MAVLREDHVLESAGHGIDRRHDLVAVRHGESSTGAEVVLDIDYGEDIVGFRGVGSLHSQPRSAAVVFPEVSRPAGMFGDQGTIIG